MNTLEASAAPKAHREQLKTRLATAEDLREANEEFSQGVKALFMTDHDILHLDTEDAAHTELATERQVLANQLLWEFDQVRARCGDRTETVTNSDGSTEVRFVFRDGEGTRANERFVMHTDQNNTLLHAECITDFGNPQELLRRISVDETGFRVEQERYDGLDNGGATRWEEMEPRQASMSLIALSSAMTKSAIKFIERSPEENREADESARTIVRRSMGLYALRASSTLK